jgi:hypothetical protein
MGATMLTKWFMYKVNATFTAVNEVQTKLLKVSSEYDFVVNKIVSVQTNADWKIRVINSEMQWSNQAVQGGNFAGSVIFPNVLLEPLVIPKNSNIELELTNGVGIAANIVQVVLEGYLVVNAPIKNRLWYQYIADKTFTIANQQAITEMRISSYKNFVVQKFVVKAATTDFQVDIIDANEKWTETFVQAGNLFGTAQQPNILLNPIIVLANSSIIFQLINGATAANAVQLCLEGYLEG